MRLMVGSPPISAAASYLVMSAATEAVTVAATSVSISSILPGSAATKPSNDMPHSMIFITNVALGLTCSIVLIVVPVVTAANEAVVGIGPLGIRNCAMAYFLFGGS